MQKRGKIEKFHTCQAQRLEALFPWNPNGRLGSNGGGQASLYPPLTRRSLPATPYGGFTRHSCGGSGGLACPCKQLAGVRLRRICILVIWICFGFRV